MTKICPACGTEMNKGLGQCPNPKCGLGGLNRMFISREDYQDWVRNVLEPHKQKLRERAEAALKRPCRVYAGEGFGLILTEGGNLYGFGNNDTGCLGWTQEDRVHTPVLVAENVVSAAAGCCHTIYLDRDGEVHLLGRSSIPYTERFQPPAGRVKAVYAAPNGNFFWLQMEDNSLFGWGYNVFEDLVPLTAKTLYTYPEISLRVEYSGSLVLTYYENSTCGPVSTSGYHYSNGGALLSNEQLRLKNSPRYSLAAQQYGDDNLEIQFVQNQGKTQIIEQKQGDIQRRRSGSYGYGTDTIGLRKVQQEYFVPELRLRNHYIFSPVPVPAQKYHEPGRLFFGSGLAESTKVYSREAYLNDVPDQILDSDKKICFTSGSTSGILTRDGYLELEDTCVVKDLATNEPLGRIRVLSGVEDFSAMPDSTVYLLREDGRIFETSMEDLWKNTGNELWEKSPWDAFREIRMP